VRNLQLRPRNPDPRNGEVLVRSAVVLLCFWSLAIGGPAAAQTTSTTESNPPLFTNRDLYFAGGFVVGTIAMFPIDRAVENAAQDSLRQANQLYHLGSTWIGNFGRTGAFVIGPTMYAAGRVTKTDRLADLGLHGTEALLVAEIANRAIKVVAGRARPYVGGGASPKDFKLFRGLVDPDYQSFVSGHAAAAFAAAAAVTSESGEWWPSWKPAIGTVMFGGASLVALSRIYDYKHWASDVVAGAAVGSFAGWKVVRWNHTTDPDNKLNRWLLGVSLVPSENGGRNALVWIAPAR
jgi:membrane-associated phospholipid phosphatase